MNNYYNDSLIVGDTQSTAVTGVFTAQVFGWMTIGLFITMIIGIIVDYLFNNPIYAGALSIAVPFVLILEVVIVFGLSFFWRRLNGMLALGLFLFYSALNGLLIGLIISLYDATSIVLAFGATAVVFLLLAIYGIVTKKDLTRWGTIAIFGLFGLIIASLFNILISFISPGLSNGIYWITNYIGVAIFMILIAYDAQKIRRLAAMAQQNGDGLLKYSIQGALSLYLDFINLFIRLLAIIGGGGRRK